jgi:hypothetical protein
VEGARSLVTSEQYHLSVVFTMSAQSGTRTWHTNCSNQIEGTGLA